MRLFLLMLCSSLLTTQFAFGFSVGMLDGDSGPVVRWHENTITYHLHSAGSADIVNGSDLNAVRAGFNQWNAVSCSALNFVEGTPASGSYNMSVGASPNGLNEVSWAEGSEWQAGAYVLGLTSSSFNGQTGAFHEADIAFNGYLNQWSTNGSSGTVDVLNVAAHEQGHFFGAQHVLGGYDPNNPPTMATHADPNLKSQTIEPDDERAACFLNPATEYFCQSDNDCPYVNDKDWSGNESYVAKLTCINSLCGGVSAQIPEGTKNFGESCASDWDCKKPYKCQQTGQGGLCTQDCQNDSGCPSGYFCLEYSNAPGGVCYPSTGGNTPGNTKDNGLPCNNSQECKSGLCVGSWNGTDAYCRQQCQMGMNECSAGETCNQLQGGGVGACLPGSGTGALKGPGENCTSPNECQSGLCVGLDGSYYCRDACNPQLGNCPEKHDCYPLQGSSGGACIPSTGGTNPGGKAGLAETCEYSSDCASEFCLAIQGENGAYCSQSCVTADNCPCGMTCSAFVGGESYCTIGGSQACTPSGNPCVTSAECISQACVDSICRDSCVLGGSNCPPGQACLRVQAGSSNGLCSPIGAGALGVACTWDSECQTLLCASIGGAASVCALPCDPATTYCGVGKACLLEPSVNANVCMDDPTPSNPEPTNPNPDSGPVVPPGNTDTGTNPPNLPGPGAPTVGGSSGGCTAASGHRPVHWGMVWWMALVALLGVTRRSKRWWLSFQSGH